MATTSKIEWTEQTWNPTVGFIKTSLGKAICYEIEKAERMTVVRGSK